MRNTLYPLTISSFEWAGISAAVLNATVDSSFTAGDERTPEYDNNR